MATPLKQSLSLHLINSTVVPTPACSMFMAMWKRSGEAGQTLRRLGIEGSLPGDLDGNQLFFNYPSETASGKIARGEA